ncbi:hematopoietic death receptor isoform X1 [Pangasianodon hypophthalmus]|uniref:hematopoietic death receptor isoform X1 n=1 Tax=Pangasianodon hypophthalmus TaxID=310915 RepID=UPI000F00EDE5|nr:hematopoietic death receptor isoform X1 [Pangasianodon hypophthalmus]
MRHFTSLLMLWIWAWSSSGSRTERDIVCRDGMGYESNDICCLNCPAGTFVKEACSTAFERGVCQQCDFDTYTEHDNGLLKCLMCTKCRPDQELVERCNSTRNTRCQCKAGSFCLPDQACEVCKICRKCKEDEEMVESCTAHSNTICRKTGSISSSTSTVVVSMVVVAFFMIIVIIGCVLYRRTSAQLASRWPRGMLKTCIENGSDLVEAKQNAVNGTLEEGAQILTQPVGEDMAEDEEDKGLGPSLPNTTASSQTSLPVCTLTSEYCLSRSLPQPLNTLEIEKLRRLVPLNGDESLRKSFDLFGEIDLNYHNRFFRLLGLSDNAIRSAEVSCSSPEDRVYELLKIWMEKEGMKANFKSLIEALLSLNQRLSAENIVARAVDCGYFSYEED